MHDELWLQATNHELTNHKLTLSVRATDLIEESGRFTISTWFTVSIDIDPDDFIREANARFSSKSNSIALGWRSCDDVKIHAPRAFRSREDIKQALNEMKLLQNNRRRLRPVWIEVVNIVGRMPFVFSMWNTHTTHIACLSTMGIYLYPTGEAE